MLLSVGCVGEGNLGAAPRLSKLDAGIVRRDSGGTIDDPVVDDDGMVADGKDSSVGRLTVQILAKESADKCDTCFDLSAPSNNVVGDYTLQWDDGSHELTRHVCPTDVSTSYAVTLLESRSGRSASANRALAVRVGTCVDAGAPVGLCVTNGTFAIDPARPPTPASALPASPWLACAKMLPEQSLPNRPQIVDSSSTIAGMAVLPATNGTTYLGLAEYEQASAQPCAVIGAGETRLFTVDLADVSGSAGADVGLPRLEIWGGRSADCSQGELLWTSKSLASSWTSHCVTITPKNLTDNLTLRATSSALTAFPGRLLVDNILPAEACP